MRDDERIGRRINSEFYFILFELEIWIRNY